MLDHRIHTFLKLCELMNYRQTAEALNMTQPAVTQHIKYLEQEYGCKLFMYNGRQLTKTSEALLLQEHCLSAHHNEVQLRESIRQPRISKARIGATKSIGDYVIDGQIIELMRREDIDISLLVHNTEELLSMLNRAELDLALIEGFFDKQRYGYRLMGIEQFVGICHRDHAFNGRAVPMETLFGETIIVREPGSGTRAIFEQVLSSQSYTLDAFSRTVCISSFELIKKLVLNRCGISFVYESVAKSNVNIGRFTIQNTEVLRELNYVYLKDTAADRLIALFDG